MDGCVAIIHYDMACELRFLELYPDIHRLFDVGPSRHILGLTESCAQSLFTLSTSLDADRRAV